MPDAPATYTLIDSTVELIHFSWQVPYDGGSPLTYYLVFWDEATGGVTYSQYQFTSAPISEIKIVNDLIGGSFYKFKIQAQNAVGFSDFSPVFEIVAAAVPSAPGAPTKVSSTTSSIDITWIDSNDNGTPIISYKIYVSINSSPQQFLGLSSTNTFSA